MTHRRSLLLVIDASVLQSAGETSHPVSSSCRQALIQILTICHRVAFTEEIRTEWKEHMSRFSRKWLRPMAAHKKHPQRVRPTKVVVDTKGLSDSDIKAIEKDLHLIEAALSADRIVVTRDDAIQHALEKTHKGGDLLRRIRWINPVSSLVAMESL